MCWVPTRLEFMQVLLPHRKAKNRLTSIAARRNHDTIHLALAEKERKRKIAEISNLSSNTKEEQKNIEDETEKSINGNRITDFYNWKQFFQNRPTHSEYLCHHISGLGKKYLTSCQIGDRRDPSSVTELHLRHF